MITKLRPNEVFVFGSNLAGNHAGGAALQAKTDFGAVDGTGEGPTGHTYAIPTMDGKDVFERATASFIHYAYSHPKQTFLLTKVGCGIAGYSEEAVIKMFKAATRTGWPKNVKSDWILK